MAGLKTISLPHGSIPTQMFGNVNLQNAMMYVNENFAAVKGGVNDAITATNDALKEKAEGDHDHDSSYAALEHTHGMDEITGLNAKLDDKAALNHEHSQYLSSLPAHYHDVSGIQGLGEQLQAKAEKTHSHTIAQVENLGTELGVKASTAYVDQQINQLSGTIKIVADQEIEDYGADKGSSSTVSDDVPKNVTVEPQNETTAQKNARVGSVDRWARADHKHVFGSSMGENPVNDMVIPEDATESTPSGMSGFVNWTSGGDDNDGVKLVLWTITGDSGWHELSPVEIDITKDGFVKSITALTDRSIEPGW